MQEDSVIIEETSSSGRGGQETYVDSLIENKIQEFDDDGTDGFGTPVVRPATN